MSTKLLLDISHFYYESPDSYILRNHITHWWSNDLWAISSNVQRQKLGAWASTRPLVRKSAEYYTTKVNYKTVALMITLSLNDLDICELDLMGINVNQLRLAGIPHYYRRHNLDES